MMTTKAQAARDALSQVIREAFAGRLDEQGLTFFRQATDRSTGWRARVRELLKGVR